jgi:alpha-D-ribose 1-methylphosphonate 5-triphosphate diphosphatase
MTSHANVDYMREPRVNFPRISWTRGDAAVQIEAGFWHDIQTGRRTLGETTARSVLIKGGRAALPDGGQEEVDILVEAGKITSVGGPTAKADITLDAGGMLVLPGIVDLHGDAFERQIMPRAGVSFPLDIALMDTDRQMAANGITTAYHGVTLSWEPGLRGREVVVELLDAITSNKHRFGCDTRFHLRFETYALDAIELVAGWLGDGRIDLLAFNNHMPSIQRKIASGQTLNRYIERSGLSQNEYVGLVESLEQRKADVARGIHRLAEIARAAGVPMASHDDETAETRRDFHDLGCTIAEFPLTAEAARESSRLGDVIVLGCPNVVRGGSHLGPNGISAAKEIAEGRGDVLCSDYYYPALARAPFVLADKSIAAFTAAWRLVSTNPARAAGLDDRGEIAVGQRADLVIIDRQDTGPAIVAATLVEGTPVYRSGMI